VPASAVVDERVVELLGPWQLVVVGLQDVDHPSAVVAGAGGEEG
jgi:hypothetical protein